MADIQKTIDIIFGGIDNTSKTLVNIEKNINTFSTNITQPLSDAGDAALKAEAAVLGLGAAFLSITVNESAKFNTALTEIGTLFNATPKEVQALATELKAFSVSSVFSIEDTNAALYNLISATGDSKTAVAGLSSAQSLAVAGASSLDTAVNALTTVLNSYGLEMTDADSASDALFVTVQNGKTTLTELSANLGKVTSTASAADVPIEDLGAAIASLTGSGVSTAESMTGLQALIRELADPTDDLKTAMGGLSLKTDGLKPVMDALKESTGGNFVAMNSLFSSVESTKSAIILANDESGTFSTTMQAMADKAGVVQKSFKSMETNLDLVAQNMTTNLNLAFIEIGSKLEKDWAGIVTSLSELFKGTTIAIDDGAFDDVFAGLSDFQIAVSTYLGDIAKVLPDAFDAVDFSGLVDSFGDLGVAIGGVFGDLDLTDSKDLTTAIQFVVDSFDSLNIVVAGIVTAWTPALQFVVGAVGNFNSMKDSSKLMAGELLGASQVFETIKGILPALGTGLTALDTLLSSIATIKTASAITSLSNALTLIPSGAAVTGIQAILAALTGPVGMVIAAGAAGVALGTLAKEGIDALIQKATGVEGQTLGSWIYDLLHADEGTTTSNLKNVSAQIVKMDGFDYQFTDKILDILQADSTAETTSGLLLDIESQLQDLSAVDAAAISKDVLSILEADLSGAATDDALTDVLDAAQALAKSDGLPATEAAVRDFDQEVADAAASAITWEDEVDKALITIGGMSGVLTGATTGITTQTDAAGDLEKIWSDLGKGGGSADQFRDATKDLLDQLSDPDGVYTDAEINTREWIKATQRQKDAAIETTPAMGDLEDAVDDLTDSERLAMEQTHELELSLLEIASNETIAAMQFKAELDIANVEANAKIVAAIFESTAQTITALTEGVTDLWGLFSDEFNKGDKKTLAEAAKRMEDRLDKELAIREELSAAQIAYMNAQVDMLYKETLVKIESDGLSQHIEAFMFEILQAIQLKVTGDKTAFLLGAGAL